ncbi:MAG: VWA domain-containing protein [Anaerolineae bacterium]|nr:VWA domain-containing protein [Anaerolineae bacterium]
MKYWLLRIVLLICGIGLSVTSHAQIDDPPLDSPSRVDGFNVMLIVDQSGSMGGQRYSSDADIIAIWGDGTDVYDQRFEGPQYAISLLYAYTRNANEGSPRNLDINISLLAFGDRQRRLLTWTDLDALTQLEFNQLLDDISAQRFGQENLGFTDFLSAFDVARDIFSTAPQPEPGEVYQDMILVLTDGAPCVPLQQGRTNCLNLEQAGAAEHLQALGQRSSQYFSGVPLYTIVFDVPGDRFDFWNDTRSDWERMVCASTPVGCNPADRLFLSQDPSEMNNQITTILINLIANAAVGINTQTLTLNQAFEMRPYVDFATITLFKNNRDPINVQFQYPPGSQTPSPDTSGTDQLVQTYEFDVVPAGEWIISSPDASQLAQPPVINLTTLDTDIMGTTPSTPIQQFTSYSFDFRIYERQNPNIDVAIYPNYPLDIQLIFYDATQPNRNQRQRLAQQPTVVITQTVPDVANYVATVFADQSSVGKFEVRLTATYPFQGQAEFLTRDQTIGQDFEVLPSYVEWRGVIENTSTRQGVPVPLRANVLQEGNNAPVTITQGQLMFVVNVTQADGTPVLSDVQLAGTPLGAGQPLPQPSTWLNDAVNGTALPSGDYQVRASLFWRSDENAPFAEWAKLSDSNTVNLTVRPIIPLQVRVTLPNDPASEVQPPFPGYFDVTPLRVQVEISTVEVTGAPGRPVSLAAITGGRETAPTLMITPGNGTPFNVPLTEGLTGIYDVVLSDLREGNYTFTASVTSDNAALIDDYEWQTRTAAITHTRNTAGYVLPSLLAALVALMIVIIVIVWWVSFLRNRRIAPLNTKVKIKVFTNGVLGSESPTFILSKVNTITLRKGLPAPLTRLVLTTKRESETSKNSQIYVIDAAAGRKSLKSDLPHGSLLPLNEIIIYRSSTNNTDSEYRLINLGAEDFMGGSAVFNDNSTETAFNGFK